MSKILDFFDLFRKGAAVSEPALWKNRSALVLALTALILTGCRVAGGFGYVLPITETDAASIATAIAVVVGLFSTYTTSDKVGVLPPKLPTDSFPHWTQQSPSLRSLDPANPSTLNAEVDGGMLGIRCRF